MLKANELVYIILAFCIFLNCTSQADEAYDEILQSVQADRCSDVISLATGMIKKFPDDPRFYYYRGFCYLKTSRQKAMEDFSNCIRKDPRYCNGYNGMALAYKDEGKYDLAEENYNKAINYAPDDERMSSFLANLSNVYSARNQNARAMELIRKAIELNDTGDFHITLGQYYLLNGRKKEAEATWLDAVNKKQFSLLETKHIAYGALANFYLMEKDYARSGEFIKKALELSPDNVAYLKFNNYLKQFIKK